MKSFFVFMIFCFVVSASYGASFECLNSYTSKKISYGPLPEFIKQEYILMSMFSPDHFTSQAHIKMIRNLPKDTKALILVPKPNDKENPFYDFPENYKSQLSESFLPLESYIQSGRIEIVEVPVDKDFNGWNDHGNWTRDFVSQIALGKNGKLKFLNMKYHRDSADRSDDYIQTYLAKKYEKQLGYQMEIINVPFYFEWGNFTTDGRGNFFVSEKVFEINSKYKISLDKRTVSKWLRETFGSQSKVVWVKPPKGESTGHVDMVMKFLDSKRVLIAKTDFRLWKNYLERLASTMEERGYEVHRIEMGFSEEEIQNSRWAQFRSYTNSLIIGNTVYVPQYDDAHLIIAAKDELARKTYRSLGYQVIKIDSSASINAGGAVHCLTCNIPNLTNFAR